MATEREIKLTLRVSDDGTLAVLNTAGQKVDELGRKTTEAANLGHAGFSRLQAGIVTLNQAIELASRGFALARSTIGALINAADESDRAILRLNTALRLSGQYTPVYSQQLQDLATHYQALTTYSDEAILGVEQFLISVGVRGPQQIEQFSRAVLGLAEFLGRDLGQATFAMSAMLGGNFTLMQRTLRPLGIQFEDSASNAEKFRVIMEKLSTLWPYATAGAQTFSGRIQQLRNIIGDLLEPMGKAITQSTAWMNVFGAVRTEIERLTARTTAWVEANRQVIDERIRAFFAELPQHLQQAATAASSLAAAFGRVASAVETVVGFLMRHPMLAGMLTGAAIGAPAGVPGIAAGAAGGLVAGAQFTGQTPLQTIVAAGTPAAAVPQRIPIEEQYLLTPGQPLPVPSAPSTAPAPVSSTIPTWQVPPDVEAEKRAREDARKALEAYHKDQLAVIEAEQTRRTIEVSGTEFALKAAQERGASLIEQIELAKALDAAEMRVLATQRDQAAVAVAQAIEVGKSAGEVEKLAAEWQKVDAALERGPAHARELTEELRRQQEELRKQHEVTVDLGQSVSSSLQRAIDGILQGGRGVSFREIFKGTGTAMASEFLGGLLQAELNKQRFDQRITENFTITLPGAMASGAQAISSIWSRLITTMQTVTASGFGSMLSLIGRFISSIGGLLRNIPGVGNLANLLGLLGTVRGAATTPGAGAAAAGKPDIEPGVPSARIRWTMPSITQLLGAAGAGIGAGSFLSEMIGGTAGRVLGGAAGGALAGTMIMPGLGTAIGALVGAIGGALFGGGTGPTQEHVNLDSIKDWVKKAGIRLAPGQVGGRPTWGGHSIIDRVFPGLTDVGDIQTINNAILAITTAGLGNEQGQAGMAVNAIANNANLLRESLEYVKDDMRELARAAGVDLRDSLAKLQEQFDTGYISLDRFVDQTAVLADIFETDFPDALDAAAIAAKHMAEGVLDIRGFEKDLQRQQSVYEQYQAAQEHVYQAQLGLMSRSRQRATQMGHLEDIQAQLAGELTPEKRLELLGKLSGLGDWFLQQSGKRWQRMGVDILEQVQGGYGGMLDFKAPIDENTQAIKDLTGSVSDLTDTIANRPGGTVNVDINTPAPNWNSPEMQAWLAGLDWQAILNTVSALPLQHGGIVTRRTLALVGEAGPEAVIPLSRGGGMMAAATDNQLSDAMHELTRALRETRGRGDTVNAEINIEGVSEPREAAEHAVNLLMSALNDFRVRRRVREVAIQG